jgi:uncharacterized protein YegL
MKKNILFSALLLSGMLVGLCAQEYYIEGFYERHGDGQYTLKNVHTNGIYLDGQTSLSKTINGTKASIKCDGLDATMVKFSFKMATTDCPSKWDNGFEFQYWDEDNSKWKTDVEACRNSDAKFSQNDVVMMLVLDYSSSMKNNISSLQASAINFINAISDASEGNIHVGIIAFSGMDLAKSQVFPITPLKESNRYEFERFIRNSSKGKETALYYSMDKAMRMLEEYVSKKGFSSDKYNGAFMITFTDGLDNASINDDISVSMHRGRKNEYLAYISNQLQGANRKYILGLPLESFAIGFTGSEDFTREDKEFFRDVLQQTTPDEEHFKLASHFEEVEAYFEYIIKNLTKRWEDLNMYIGESQHGRIRWVLNCGKKKVDSPIKIKEPSSFWLGLGVEAGIGLYYEEYYGYGYYYKEGTTTPGFAVRADAAWPLSSKISLGGTLSLGYCNDIAVRIGPLAKFNFSNGSAFLVGVGFQNWDVEDLPLYVTLGWKFNSPWYINASMNGLSGFCVGIGYSICGGR